MRTEDGSIIDKCLNGEPEAFGFLVDKYKESIYAFAYTRLRNFHDAEDITQEVFIKAYQKLGTLKRWDKFLAWLYSITANLCKNFWVSRSRRPDREYIEEQDDEFWEQSSVDAYQDGCAHESLHDALAALPEMQRQVLTLYYLGGMSSREIANFLGTSPNTVNQRLMRARAQLKEEILNMMSTTFDEMKLQPGFTLWVVEMIKGTKPQSATYTKWLPWGLSVGTGVFLALMSLTSHLTSLIPIRTLIGSPMPSQTQVAEKGVIPVDVVAVTNIPILSSDKGKKDFGGKPKPKMNAFAPPGQEGKWTKRADMPTARTSLSTSVVDGKIYAIGGRTAAGFAALVAPGITVEEYNPATDTWTKKANMPTPRYGFSTSVVNGKIYAIGGWGAAQGAISTVEEYDPATDTWTKKADMPIPRWLHSASVVKGKIYVIGGAGSGWPPAVLPSVQEYDPVTDTWTKKADMPAARWGLSTSVVNGKIYAMGGNTVWSAQGAISTVEEYAPSTDKWAKKVDMPTPRNGLSTSVVNGKIYAMGGDGENGDLLAVVEEYDPVTDTWTKKANMPTPRDGLSTSVVNGKIYAIGGWTADGLSTVEEYDPGTPQSVNPAGKFPTLWGKLKAR